MLPGLAPAALAGAALLDVPVTPDAEEARRWAQEELSRGIYADRTGLLERVLTWVGELLASLGSLAGRGPGWLLPTVVILGTALVVTVALLVGGPVRRRRAVRRDAVLLPADGPSAERLRASADAASAAGDHRTAVVDRFRAIVRELADRVLVADEPGLTADEAAQEAGQRLPDVAPDLRSAAGLFDGVRYGGRPVGPAEDGWLRDVDARVRRARPTPAHAPAVPR